MRKFLFTIFLIAIVLSGCGDEDIGRNVVGQENNIKLVVTGNDVGDGEIEPRYTAGSPLRSENKEIKKLRDDGREAQVFVLDIDGELFDIEMPEQEGYTSLDSEHLTGYTAFDVLKQYAEEKGIELKIKEYDFGVLVEGIGDKIGDKNNFWLYYVNDKMANASADKVAVEPGDVIRFEWAGKL